MPEANTARSSNGTRHLAPLTPPPVLLISNLSPCTAHLSPLTLFLAPLTLHLSPLAHP